MSLSFGIDRCKKYEHLVRRYHFFYFGVDFPYWYSVGQIKVESNCRHGVWSFDEAKSFGLAQITWKIWKDTLKKHGINEIWSVKGNLKAQAFINYLAYKTIKKKIKWCERLWVMYQIYNGGTLVIKEIKKAGICNWCAAYSVCRRKDICWTYKGKKRCKNACDINYEYSKKVFEYGLEYKVGADKFRYW